MNDWQFGGIYNARTGQPINITNQNDQAENNEPNQRMNLNPGTTAVLPSSRHRAQKV